MFNAKQELAKLEKAIMETLVVPNSWLPEEMHDHKRGGRTLSRLNQICDKRDGLTEHAKKQIAKAENIEKMRKQVEEKSIYHTHKGGTDFVDLDGELDWSDNNIDDQQLTKNMQALVGGMVNGGLIDAEDLLED